MLSSSIQWLTNDTDTGGDALNMKIRGTFRFCDTHMQVKMQLDKSFTGFAGAAGMRVHPGVTVKQ